MATEVEEKEEICRCCLARDREVISLQEETEIDGKRLSFMKLLSLYTRGVTFQPWQPPNICMECVQHLENAHRFNETCLKSQEYHKNKFFDPRRKGTRDTAVKEKLPSTKPTEVLPKCIDLKTSTVKKLAITKPPRTIKLKCDLCQKQFMSAEYLKMHTSKHKSNIYCNTCNIKYTNELQLNQHIDNVHLPEGHMCLLCLKLFKTVLGLQRHRLRAHSIQPKNLQLDAENIKSDHTYLETIRKDTIKKDSQNYENTDNVLNAKGKDADKERVTVIIENEDTEKLEGMNIIPNATRIVEKDSTSKLNIILTGPKTRERTIESPKDTVKKEIKNEDLDGKNCKELMVKDECLAEGELAIEVDEQVCITETDRKKFDDDNKLLNINKHTVDGKSEAHERMDAEDGVANSDDVLIDCDVGIHNPSEMEDSHHGEVSNYEDVSFVEEQIVPEDSEQEEMVQYYVVEGDDEENLVEITPEHAQLLVKGEALPRHREEEAEEVSVTNQVELESTEEQEPAAADNEEPSVGEATHDELEPGELPREVDAVDAMTSRAHGAYKCLLCAATTEQRFSMARHLAIVHRIEALVCTRCGDKFDKVNKYVAHKQTHCFKRQREYVKPDKKSRQDTSCLVCGVTCATSRQLTTHMRVLHKTRSLKECHICKKIFTSRYGYSTHMDAHSGKRRQRCTMCPRVLSDSKVLRKHILGQHSHYRPHLCSECGRSFVSTDMLHKHHKLKHEGRRDFLCGVCGRTFQQASHVTQHMLQHTGVKPYECRYCKKCYKSGSGLKRHYYRVHNAEYTWEVHKGDVRRRRLLRAGAKAPVGKDSRTVVSSQA